MSGLGEYQTPNGRFNIKAGQMFVIFPHEVTTYKADQQSPWHYCWIGFETTLNLNSILSSYVLTFHEFSSVFTAILDSDHIDNGREYFLCGRIYDLIYILNKQHNNGAKNTDYYVNIALNIIQISYMDELSVEELARRLNIDKAYFSRIFHKRTGKPPWKYIVDFRLDKAAELISTHRLPPGEAAEAVGYNSLSNFSRMFRRRFGVPPSSYI
jgi:AraC-like DNA-binding protein